LIIIIDYSLLANTGLDVTSHAGMDLPSMERLPMVCKEPKNFCLVVIKGFNRHKKRNGSI